MGILSKLFGADDAVKSVLDTGRELLDDAFYTDAEQAADRKESAQEVRSMLVEWLKNTQGQNLSRRLIALSTTGVWLFLFLVATFVSVAGIWVDEAMAVRLTHTATMIDNRNEIMTSAVMLILAFYFAAPKVGEIAEAAIKGLSRKPS